MTAVLSPTLSAHGAQIPALGFGTSPMTGGLVARHRGRGAPRRLSPHRHRAEIRHRARRRRGDARLGRAARRDFPHHQGQPRISARRRFRQIGGREPRRAQGRLRRPADGALAEPGDPAQRDHAGAGQGQAAGPGAAHRRRQLQHRAARPGDPALPRAAGGAAGRVSSLSRPDRSCSTRCAQRGMAFVAYCPLGRGRLFSDPVLAEIAQGARQAASRRSRCAG